MLSHPHDSDVLSVAVTVYVPNKTGIICENGLSQTAWNLNSVVKLMFEMPTVHRQQNSFDMHMLYFAMYNMI